MRHAIRVVVAYRCNIIVDFFYGSRDRRDLHFCDGGQRQMCIRERGEAVRLLAVV